MCVVGGGPAGSSVARRLSMLGYRVCIVERHRVTRPEARESIAPSIGPALDALGVLPEIQRAGFLLCRNKHVRWSGDNVIAHHDQLALLIDRGRFDSILLAAAVDAGTTVLRPASARRPARGKSGWIITADTSSGSITIVADFVVCANGKQSTSIPCGRPTAALCGQWRAAGLPASPEMCIEAGRDAWFWGATSQDGLLCAFVFLDTRRCAGLRRNERAALYRSLLDESNLLRFCLEGERIGDIAVRDVTCRFDPNPVTAQSINVGDRCFAMDPISSQGIQAAIRSGVQAAAVVHTILGGGDTDAAIGFYRNAHQQAVRRHRRVATELYAAQALHDSPFWRARSGSAALREATRPTVAPPSPETRVRLASDARLAEMPVIDGGVIRRRAALIHPALEQPITWLGGVALAPALETIGSGQPVAAILARWSRNMPMADAREVLGWLMQYGILVNA